MKWGWLHDFAIDCMKYSLENFPFDILTIVDSDQLCVNRNYSNYMAKHLNPGENIGMLGITGERQTYGTKIDPAITAYKEIGLWKPFLERFPGGIDKFLYWTFWPSTVFTIAAAIDLVNLFDNDRQLKEILQKTKIWASEEVILPTLVSLLGYKIKTNPCSFDYVKYRKKYSLNEIKSALMRPDVFWAHPVERKTDNQLRLHIAGYFDNYNRAPRFENEKNIDSSRDNTGYIFVMPIIRQIKNIEGWLDDEEAELIIHAAYDVLKNNAKDTAVIEIVSYCGKTSIILGNIIKSLGNTSLIRLNRFPIFSLLSIFLPP
ncbi:MAG TPA: hypothetical protein VK186_01720 [Candidatus Deferrimicrobium sp.]|nr:hypothetical protein [Candidatus Kapabacteria bacterium]HLP57511.1 hypothetical protein [Candidatus Deferrimicrobium sp.]